jgi:hypothetical protein
MIEEPISSWLFSRGTPDYTAHAAARRCERKLQQGAIPGISNLTAIRLAKTKPGHLLIAIAYGGHFSGDVLSGDPRPEEVRAAADSLAREELKGTF